MILDWSNLPRKFAENLQAEIAQTAYDFKQVRNGDRLSQEDKAKAEHDVAKKLGISSAVMLSAIDTALGKNTTNGATITPEDYAAQIANRQNRAEKPTNYKGEYVSVETNGDGFRVRARREHGRTTFVELKDLKTANKVAQNIDQLINQILEA